MQVFEERIPAVGARLLVKVGAEFGAKADGFGAVEVLLQFAEKFGEKLGPSAVFEGAAHFGQIVFSEGGDKAAVFILVHFVIPALLNILPGSASKPKQGIFR